MISIGKCHSFYSSNCNDSLASHKIEVSYEYNYNLKMEIKSSLTKRRTKYRRKTILDNFEPLDSIISPKSQTIEVKSQNLIAYSKFTKFFAQRSIKNVIQFLRQIRGSNIPTNYNKQYNFKQKWEMEVKQNEEGKVIIKEISDMYSVLSFLLMVVKMFLIWITSIFRIFQYTENEWIFILGLFVQLTDVCIKIPLFIDFSNKNLDLKQKVLAQIKKKAFIFFLSNFYCLIYYLLGTIRFGSVEEIKHTFALPFDVILVFFHYERVEQIYRSFRITVVRSRYKNWMYLFDLMSNLFIMAHLFAILLYACTFASPDDNWLAISAFASDTLWINKYIYSFYFVCTTMLTVGYGDLKPTNVIQIMSILAIQFFGIINFGYVISQIGCHLSKMRQLKENLEKDIIDTEKLAKYNKMTSNLKHRVRDFIFRNQLVNEQLDAKQEEMLLGKLSQELKTEVVHENQLRIIKSSLFLLSNFSKRMQLEISKKLIKTIYSPNTTLVQTFGKEKLFILTRGTVNIFTESKLKGKTAPQKLLKTIQKQFKEQVYDISSNVYGYSAFFSGKPSRIKAVAKNFSICFTLDHQALSQCISDVHEDFQFYHQLMAKYHLTHYPQKYEAPNVVSNREHYIPNIFYLIKKEKKNYRTNIRQFSIRANKKFKLILQKCEDESLKNFPRQDSMDSSQDEFNITFDEQTASRKQRAVNYEKMLQNSNKLLNLGKSRMFVRKYANNKRYEEIKKMKLQNKFNILLKEEVFVENFKEYKSYFPKGNFSRMVKRNKQERQYLTIPQNRLQLIRKHRFKQMTTSN